MTVSGDYRHWQVTIYVNEFDWVNVLTAVIVPFIVNLYAPTLEISTALQATVLVIWSKVINDVSVTPVGAVTTIEYTMSVLVQKTESSVYSSIVTKLGSTLTLHYYSDPDAPVAVI